MWFPLLATLFLLGSGAQRDAGGRLLLRTAGEETRLIYEGPEGHETLLRASSAVLREPALLEHAGVVAASWREGTRGEVTSWYRVSLDGGGTFGRARRSSYELLLRHGSFDPLPAGAPWVRPALAAGPDNELFILQFRPRALEAWRREIRALGGVELRFLGNHAGIWRLSADAARNAARLPFVRWTGAFHPAYRLDPAILATLGLAGGTATARYNVVVGERGPAQKRAVAEAVEALGGRVDFLPDSGFRLEASLDRGQLLALAHRNEVLWIDRWGPPGLDMDNVRVVMGAGFLESVAGFRGTGVRAEVMDQGLDEAHPDWAPPRAPLLHGSNASSTAHGTAVFGINFGAGVSTPAARGLLPEAQGIFASFVTLGDRYTHTRELLQPPYEAVYQTNSWGGPRTSSYTSAAAEMDDIILLYDLAIVQTQGNGNLTESRPEAWAKNIISVSGNLHFDNADDGDDIWGGGTSTGPASDGRVKPDLTAYSDSVWTSDAEPGGYASGTHYTGFGGSSSATAIVAGHLGLIHEMWHAGIFGNPTGATVFASRPHQSLAKALLVHSARQYPDTQADFTRFNQGWGKPDLQWLYELRDRLYFVDETVLLRDQEVATWRFVVEDGSDELRATLVYVDPPATLGSTRHRINDLSLRVTSPSGVTYWGNHGLTAGSYNSSTPGGSSNDLDTVENVFLPGPEAGVWTVEVLADEVNADTHGENGNTPPDVDFALAVSPVTCRVDAIALSGPSQTTVGATVTYTYAEAPPASPFAMLYAPSRSGTMILGHCLDIGPGIRVAGTGVTGATGSGSWTSAPVPPSAAGRQVFVEMVALGPGGVVDSNVVGLRAL